MHAARTTCLPLPFPPRCTAAVSPPSKGRVRKAPASWLLHPAGPSLPNPLPSPCQTPLTCLQGAPRAMQQQQGAATAPLEFRARQQGPPADGAAATAPQQLRRSSADVCLPVPTTVLGLDSLQYAAAPLQPQMQQAQTAVALPPRLPLPPLPAAPAGWAEEQACPSARPPVPARLPGRWALLPHAAAAEVSDESISLESDQKGAAAAGTEPPDGSLPPDRAWVEARLQALGATLLFEKVRGRGRPCRRGGGLVSLGQRLAGRDCFTFFDGPVQIGLARPPSKRVPPATHFHLSRCSAAQM